MRLADFDYDLPDTLIARYPPPRRRDSRLLVADAGRGRLEDRRFAELPALLAPGDLLVFNDTRVLPARLHGRKASGGRIEVLIERIEAPTEAFAHVRASKPPKADSRLELPGGAEAIVTGRAGGLFALRFDRPLEAYLEEHGEVPLPPYLGRAADDADRERYQTVYARAPGAVAAPTAGLHFDAEMLDATRNLGVRHAFVTLHVGAGTFLPLRRQDLEASRLHAERVSLDAETCDAVTRTRAAGGRVIAVGTTSLRALESAWRDGTLRPCEGETDLFIVPGFRFRCVDALLTNFHLPRSSLLLLVAAFGGTEFILGGYRHAVSREYRFYSYGDAMFVLPPDTAAA